MNRKIALLMAAVMVILSLQCNIIVSADNEAPDVAVESGLLCSMGITDGVWTNQKSLTRGEFAQWITRLAGLDENTAGSAVAFTDVPESNKYAAAVSAVSGLGIMNGTGKGEFGVKENIGRVDAMVALIRLLGYEVAAKSDGGYPGGYIKRAARLGLDKGTDRAAGNEYCEILIMCFNALDVPYLDMYGEVVRGTLFEDIHGIYESEGIVTANIYTSLGDANGNVPAGKIQINGENYLTDNTELAESIGEYINFWYKDTKGTKDNELVFAYSDAERNDILIIKAEDINSAKSNTVEYINEKDRTESAKLQPGFTYILNNRTLEDRLTENLVIDDGELILIDNDSDGVYEVVKSRVAETMVFQGVDETEDIIYCREGNIKTEPFDNDYFAEYILVDETDGSMTEITVDEIPADSVLTVYRSADGKYLQVYAYLSNVYGVLQEIGDEDVTIDGVVYKYPLKTPVEELNIGAKVNFSLDMYGRLVYLEDENYFREPIYGYFFDYAKSVNMSDNSQIRVVLGDTNSILTLDDDVRIDDGISYKHDELDRCSVLFGDGKAVYQIIRYRLNGDGRVTDIYTTSGNSEFSIKPAADINKNNETTYYQWYRIYAGKYILPQENFFLVAPTVGDEPDDIELYGTSYYFGDDIASCYCEVYDVNDDMEAGAVIIYSQDPLKGKATTTANTAVGIVEKLTKGEFNNYIYLWNGNETVKYELDSENIPDIKMYEFGDVVRYVLGKNNVVTTLDMVLDIGTTGENTPPPVYYQDGYEYHHFSRVYKKLDTHFVLVPNYNNPTFDDSVSNRIVAPTYIGSCAVIDMAQKKIIKGSYSSMSQYFEKEGYGACYAYTRLYKWNAAKELFIYKF